MTAARAVVVTATLELLSVLTPPLGSISTRLVLLIFPVLRVDIALMEQLTSLYVNIAMVLVSSAPKGAAIAASVVQGVFPAKKEVPQSSAVSITIALARLAVARRVQMVLIAHEEVHPVFRPSLGSTSIPIYSAMSTALLVVIAQMGGLAPLAMMDSSLRRRRAVTVQFVLKERTATLITLSVSCARGAL